MSDREKKKLPASPFRPKKKKKKTTSAADLGEKKKSAMQSWSDKRREKRDPVWPWRDPHGRRSGGERRRSAFSNPEQRGGRGKEERRNDSSVVFGVTPMRRKITRHLSLHSFKGKKKEKRSRARLLGCHRPASHRGCGRPSRLFYPSFPKWGGRKRGKEKKDSSSRNGSLVVVRWAAEEKE